MPDNGSRVRDDAAGYDLFRIGEASRDFGAGYDFVKLTDRTGTVPQVRITFTSSEVGNDSPNDAGTGANQDGGLAVRVQREDETGALTGGIGRFDDEGISFVADGSFTFDVRDLVSGVSRGDQFTTVRLGTGGDDLYSEGGFTANTYINGGRGNDDISGGLGNDFLVGGAGNDFLSGGRQGDDSFIGGAGDDTIMGYLGDDLAIFNVSTDGSDTVDLGRGRDRVNVSAATGTTQVRLTFTSAEVGNNNALDAGTLANQDGLLAVRLQAEDGSGALTGAVSRFDDEGTTFFSSSPGLTFDVRDLVSGVARGDQFQAVQLGTVAGELLDNRGATLSYYVNGGQGADNIFGGDLNDFLVGGAGDDRLVGAMGADSFIGGAGNDTILGGIGDDVAIFNISTDGADSVDLGRGDDRVNVSATASSQIRLTFTSAEVGNNNASDSGTLANQDGGLAVRMQAEDNTDTLVGAVSRYDDEGVTFVASSPFLTFDVRDLVSGVARGDQFQAVQLGTVRNDVIDHRGETISYYVNGGQGTDRIIGGDNNDFLVGGAGDDRLVGGLGNDSFIGGAGNDTITGDEGSDTAIFNVSTDGTDTVDLGVGSDRVNVSAAAGTTQIRLTFTSAEVGNNNASDGGALANQDGGLAVRLQAEDALGNLAGGISRFDDEGITFASASAGLTFDVRDLVSGTERGNQFAQVFLGSGQDDTLGNSASGPSTYFNGGAGNDTIFGGLSSDFLVGGAGNDRLYGGNSDDQLLGGAGADLFEFNGFVFTGNPPGNDTILDFVSGTDKIDLSAYGLNQSDITSSMSGSNTVLSVDINNDTVADFTITLTNAGMPVASDFIL